MRRERGRAREVEFAALEEFLWRRTGQATKMRREHLCVSSPPVHARTLSPPLCVHAPLPLAPAPGCATRLLGQLLPTGARKGQCGTAGPPRWVPPPRS